MDTGFDKTKLLVYKAAIFRALGSPMKLRLTVVAATLALAIVAAYMPFSDRIAQARAQLGAQRKRLDTIQDVISLRREIDTYRSQIAKHSDTNEWIQFVLTGSRLSRIRLRNMESKPPEKVGPYKTVTLTLELEGSFPQLRQFVEWMEQSGRLLRVEEVRFERQPANLMMKLRMLGLVQNNNA